MRLKECAGAPWRAVTAGVLLGGVLLIVYCVGDRSHGGLLPPCPVHWATGLYCPGCGSTRAVHSLLHGDLRGALAKNPLMVGSIPLILWLCLRPHWACCRSSAWIALVVLLTYGVLRNLNAFPFTLLAPH